MHRFLRILTGIGFILAGVNHFHSTAFYVRIIPPWLPWPVGLVIISGVAEIAGGAGLLIPRLRAYACGGLIALLIAVFPANLYMALSPNQFADLHLPTWVFWARLPLQPLFIAWVWYVGRQSFANQSALRLSI